MPFEKMHIEKILTLMLSYPGLAAYKKISSIDFYILDDAHMARAAGQYMHSSGPSNILSFPGDKDFPGAMLFSADTFEREYTIYGQPPKEYFIYLIAHACGHLAGLEHGEEMYCLCEMLNQHILEAAISLNIQ